MIGDKIPGQQESAPGKDWLKIAEDAYSSSTTYFDANYRKNIERNIALFQSRHPDGSKYNSEQYKKRSRLFRPKTKSAVRKNEAAAAAAFFANVDVVTVETENDSDLLQVASAELMNEALNLRLTKDIPWFLTLIGALQVAQVVGIIPSYQYWHYAEKPTKHHEAVLDDQGQPLNDANGDPYYSQTDGYEVIKDKPCVDLIPIENFRFDAAADWTDVVGTSPYIIRKVPMYVDSVRQRMKTKDVKTGELKWKSYTDNEIRQAMVDYDTIRQQRENKRQDPLQSETALKEFEIVWCHENFIRMDGEDLVYWTLGTKHLLTEPKPLKEVYFTGIRPFVVGCAVMEAHKAMPDSYVSIGSELQKEVNETVNSRRDNVALVLNKRYVVKRNAQVDVDSLLKNVSGSVTMANDPEGDVKELVWTDVTSSAYQEQDRLNVDFDELLGNFSQSSVQTNRKLNETVGGMELMGGSANQMTEYLIRTFVETWVEPVLRQLVELEKNYETDETVIALAGQKANLPPDIASQIMQAWHTHDMTVSVNVGMGATDPHKKMGKFTFAMQTYSQVMQSLPDADPEAVRREVFGLAGYKDGSRFFKKEDNPVNQQLKMQLDEAQKALQELQQTNAKQELQLQDKSGELRVKEFDAQTKRDASLKEDPVQGEDPRKLDMDAMNQERDRMADLEKTRIQEAAAERQQLLELAASMIEAQMTKPNPGQAIASINPETVSQTLAELMAAVNGLSDKITAPRRREIVRDPVTGKPIASIESLEQPS